MVLRSSECHQRRSHRHDDRIDCLAQGVKYFTDAFGISAMEEIKARKRDEWNQMLEAFLDDPQQSANHLVFGMTAEQQRQARGKTSVSNWV